jgi:hypothetical protein
MIVLQMVIVNLTVAAVIDGLSSARKDNIGIIKKDEINELVKLWSEYDPEATGWIEVSDLVFLLYELPQPMGYGKDMKLLEKSKNSQQKVNDHSINHILEENIHQRDDLKQRLNDGLISEAFKSESNFDPDDHYKIQRQKTIRNKTDSVKFLVKKERNIFLRKVDAIKILDNFDIPYYENKKVHFKDISKKVIDNTFKTKKLNIQIGTKLKKRIRRRWQKRYNLTKHKKINIDLQRIMAAKVLLKWIQIYKKGKGQRRLIVDKSIDMLEKRLSKNLIQEISEMKSEQQNEIEYSEDDENKEEKKVMKEKKDTEEYSKVYDDLVRNNPSIFSSIKVVSPEFPKKEKLEIKHRRKPSKFKHLIPKASNSNNSFTLPPMGGFFQEGKDLEKIKKSKKSKKLAKMEKQMLKTNALGWNVKGNMAVEFKQDKDEYYSLQQIDKNELDYD